ncbi:ABC transporter substrate-binding protein [Rhodocaloribacter litoris]|uniref:ABC transporter substrate-binding protein n=1 Tax=Rhodocaloribacter litoris TaxID=2558931 RepID=UPI00142044AC|nr:ABC transporter substrate-binding protein [Rhodocaloribacter litoris]QXD15592.1 ABC transporter substrate-binding protein [Rhodocaloribacter litoris]
MPVPSTSPTGHPPDQDLPAYNEPPRPKLPFSAGCSRIPFVLLVVFLAGCGRAPAPEPDLARASWEEIERLARGQTVDLLMWTGDPYINAYMRTYVIPTLRERHGITLNIVPGQGNQIVSMLMTEREAGKTESAFDMMWINGETFYQLRQIDALYGPFTERLPNARYIDFDDPFIGIDFQQPVDGYEMPWGNVQWILIYDSARVSDPPRTPEALAAWVKAHPGRFTFDTSFTGMTFLKTLLIHFAGGPGRLSGPFDPETYARHAPRLWRFLNEIKPYLWKRGETFPASVTQLHQLFAAGEIDFTMSNNDGEVDNKVLQGLFPETARAYVLDGGTIRNTHYLGIVKTAPHKAGALVVCNFLISPEAQLKKLDPQVWGDGTVLDLDRLPPAWQERFRNVSGRRFAPDRAAIRDRALQEPDATYMIRLYDDFRREVIGR